MRRLIPFCVILAAALLLPAIAAAQTTSASGQIIDDQGAPWAGIDVMIQNTTTGQTFDAKTDKDGRYTQLGLQPGVYKFTVVSQPDEKGQRFTYSETHALKSQQDNDVDINLKKIIATSHPEAQKNAKEAEESKAKFNNMKSHFDAGVAAMSDSDTLRTQLTTTPADQRGAVQDKLNTDYKTAIGEFQQAQQADAPTDVKNQAIIWANLAQVYEYSGQYDDAVNAYEKAISFQPTPAYYTNLSKVIANQAAALTDPSASAQKIADATADCDKVAALDLTAPISMCYKNIGIILSNKGDMKDAIPPLQKTTESNPKDSQAWFLLGSALLATAETKQEGNKITTVFPPGTEDAFKKCIDTDPKGPSGPYASQAKEVLNDMASMNGGEATTVKKK
jgi:tetratricopeptide (TPR) repeat protein